MNLKNVVGAIVVLGAVILTGRIAFAATAPGTLTVTANVIAACTITDATLDFGDYDPLGVHNAANLDVSTTMQVRCTNGTTYGIGLDGGGSGDVAARVLTGASGTLPYQLYSDAFGGTNWDNNTLTNTYTAGATPTDHTIYGRINMNQAVAAGAYSDTVTATVNF